MKGEPKCVICRRAGEKLFLKGERCFTPKCAIIRKPYPPGSHGRSRQRALSEYGVQLREKQKVKHSYNILERQMRRYFEEAARAKGQVPDVLLQALERRLDNVVFRLGIAKSRSIARHMTSHGHIMVNDRVVDIPSYEAWPGDRIRIKPSSASSELFRHLEKQKQAKHPPVPSWLEWDAEKKEGKMLALPTRETVDIPYDMQHLIEFYSR
ncbi:MAG: 30S ribosomal protein S4 [Parcubacteria group bacterium]|nr:30S ribosomal protein S4 [Parcubacteria group bacterium]